MIALLCSAALVSFGRRVVGGVMGDDWHIWKVPHVLACLFFAATVAAAVMLGGGPWWGAIPAGLGAWLGHTVKGLWDSAGMGHLPPDNLRFSWKRLARDWCGMTAYGVQCAAVSILLAACPLVHGSWHPALLGGAAVAPLYFLSWRIFYLKPIGWPAGVGPVMGLGEWMWGAALGAGVCAAMQGLI